MAITTSKIRAGYEDPDNPGQLGPVADIDEIDGGPVELIYSIEPGYIVTPSLTGRYILNLIHLPYDFDSTINRMKIVIQGQLVHDVTTHPFTTGKIAFDIDDTEAQNILVALGGVPTVSVSGEIRFQFGNGVIITETFTLPVRAASHDSSSGGATARDHQRLDQLEQKTEDITYVSHDGWEDASASRAALFIVPSTYSLNINNITLLTWAASFEITTASALAGSVWVLLRVETGRSINGVRVVQTAADGTVKNTQHGIFTSELNQGGFSYYAAQTYSTAAVDDVFTAQIAGQEQHLTWTGDVAELERHELDHYAHQDSPIRVTHLGINAPRGREVYLTQIIKHPQSERIHAFPPRFLSGAAQNGLFGASVIDLTGNNGPPVSSNISGYPAVINAQRVAAIWQSFNEQEIRLAVRANIGTPTILHMGGLPERTSSHTWPLVADGGTPTIGGVQYRLMRTDGARQQHAFRDEASETPPSLTFSLGYNVAEDLDYLAGDGTLVAGMTQDIGLYQAEGNGGWRSHGDIDLHETQPHAHQDSPKRVSRLSVGAPTGRQVYLTSASLHPTSDTIFSVPLTKLGNFIGATVADFTSIGGPDEATSTAGYPAIMNVARISGIWQPIRNDDSFEQSIFVAVRGNLGEPTSLHISGSDFDLQLALVSNTANPSITVGGNVNRVVRTEALREQVFEDLLAESESLVFSLEYATGFLDDDATIDAGVNHTIGHYESEGNGQWETRGEAILNNLASMLENASVSTKQRLLDALSYEEILHQTTSTPSRSGWNQFTLNRAIVAADDNKKLSVVLSNDDVDVTLSINAGDFRNHATQGGGSNRVANTHSFAFAVPNGDNDVRGSAGRTVIHISRPNQTTPNTNILMLLCDTFGTGDNRWNSVTITIKLEGF